MKKNISINISGIIFHIEEDGYEVLKKYLDSINKYFSSYEDSNEILADIESRIAEIFLSKLYEGKQVITSEDVNALKTTMGSVSDFKAAEEEESFTETPKEEKQQENETFSSHTSKQFMRDQQRKILGGVCAGLGNYFNVDPVWIRLLFVLLSFSYGLNFLIYIILWIAVPGSYELDEPKITKKLFRDPDKKVLGGVASGLAAYMKMDVVVIRLIFVITACFGGAGFIAYIVFWMVTPEARSITDKMQMQGEAVTLSNIESNIKKEQTEKPDEEESALVKILLFPFRAIGWLLTGLAKILNPVAEVLRVGIGIFIMLMGLSLVVSVLVTGGVLFGLLSSGWIIGWHDVSLPMEAINRGVPTFTAIMAFVGGLIPGIIIMLLGISAIANRIVFGAATGWSLFILFFLSMVVMSVSIPKIVINFKEDGEYKIEQVYNLEGKTAVLKIRETGLDDYKVTSLSLKGYEGTEIKLVQVYEAQGITRMQAAENAKMVEYTVTQQDSVITFDSNLRFKPDAIFRAQRLKMTLYIPYDYPFVLDDNTWRLINQYFDYDKRNGNTWIIEKDGYLKCVTCPEEVKFENERVDWDSDLYEDHASTSSLTDFDELEISGLFDIRVKQGNSYSVELTGPDKEKAKYRISRLGSTLVVEYDDGKRFNWRSNPLKVEQVRINITMPEVEKINLKGAGKASFTGFTEDDLRIKILGAINVTANINARDLAIYLSGASELTLNGEGDKMDANILGASKLNGYGFEVKDAVVEANGASKANVYVTGRLEVEEGLASKVSYKGKPAEVIKD
ncbi:MAG: PspC domain-containing protein [Cyclobacteriaceae bacterium]|nr:PspC domain-containing protein [Cyclobacteriaceae bacterium]